jgi:hypothetical protein
MELISSKFFVMPDSIRHPEKDEYLSVHMISFDHALNMIYKDDIYDSKTISGIFLDRKALERSDTKINKKG